MKIEVRRGIRSGFFGVFILVNILNVILGYILLVSVDHLQNITFQDLFESTYAVYTQFGTLLFSTFIIMRFYVDYKEKNILFFKALGVSALQYFLFKIAVLIVISTVGSFIAACLLCLPYLEFTMIPIAFLKIESVMLYYSFFISALAFLIGDFLKTFFVSFFVWIIGILVSSTSPFMEYFAYYDASNSDNQYFLRYLAEQVSEQDFLRRIVENYLYDLGVLVICTIVVVGFRKRWMKNGI